MNPDFIMEIHSRYEKAWWKLVEALKKPGLTSTQFSKVHQRIAFVQAIMYGLRKATGL